MPLSMSRSGASIEDWQWPHIYRAVFDMRTIVECSPQFGHTRTQLEAVQAVHAAVAAGQVGRPQPRLMAGRADVAQGLDVAHARREPRDEEAVGAVAVRERLQVLRHGRMLPERQRRLPRSSRRNPRERPGRLLTTLLVLDGRDRAGRVDEGTAGPERRSLRRRGSRAAARPAPAGGPALRQRASGREASVPRSLHGGSTSTRSNARRRAGCVGVAGADVDDRRAHARGGPAQRVGAAGVLLDGDDLALVAHQRREVGGLAAGRGAQVEHALARLRARALARPPSPRATAASAGRRSHSGASKRVERARRGSAPRSSTRVRQGRRSASSGAVVLSVFARSDGLGGLVVGGHQRAGVSARRARRTTAARSTRGASARARPAAGVASGSLATIGARLARRRAAAPR